MVIISEIFLWNEILQNDFFGKVHEMTECKWLFPRTQFFVLGGEPTAKKTVKQTVKGAIP